MTHTASYGQNEEAKSERMLRVMRPEVSLRHPRLQGIGALNADKRLVSCQITHRDPSLRCQYPTPRGPEVGACLGATVFAGARSAGVGRVETEG